jgi:hypothetical protein
VLFCCLTLSGNTISLVRIVKSSSAIP